MYAQNVPIQDKTITVPLAFRNNIVRQLEQEMNRCGGLDKSPQEVELYIYNAIHTKEEYLEKIGKIILGLQQKQQQQGHPQQNVPPGQMQYGVRQQFQQQGQYVQYQQHSQGQQPATVLIQTGQAPQLIRQPGMSSIQGQPHFRPNPPRPGVMHSQQPPQQMVNQFPQQNRQPFPPGQSVMLTQQQASQQSQPPQPNVVMGQNNQMLPSKMQPGIAMHEQRRQASARGALDQPGANANQPQIVFSSQQQQQQQQFFKQQSRPAGQFPGQSQQIPSHQIPHQSFQQGPPSHPGQHPSQNQQYVAVSTPQAPPSQPSALPRQSRSFNQGTNSPAVGIPSGATGPSPLGPKGGPGSVGPVMSPMMTHQQAGGAPHQLTPHPQPMSANVVPPASEAPPQETADSKPVQSIPQVQQSNQEEIQEKLKQLAKYKEPLRMIIANYENSNSSTKTKMKRILEIISGPTCESMAMLKKCEEACQHVISRYYPEPTPTQVFMNALSKLAVAAENLATQQPQLAKNGREALSCISSRAFNSLSMDMQSMDFGDLGEDWNRKLQIVERMSSEVVTPSPIFPEFNHLSRAAQRELLFLSDKYDISCRSNTADSEGSATIDDLIAIDFVPKQRCLIDAGAPTVCLVISPDYPESPDTPQVIFSPASDLNPCLAAIRKRFTAMYESVKLASVSEVSLIRLITFYEASVLSEL